MSANKICKKAFSFLLLLITIYSTIIPCMAASTTNRIVRVACGMNEVLYLDKDGDPAGIGLPYIRQLAWNMNWTLEYVEGSYNESLNRLCNGEIDLMFPVGKEEDSEGKLAYSEMSAGYQQIGLFARKDADIYYDDYAGFNHAKVGLSIGGNSNILDQYAKKNGFTYKQVPLNSTQDKILALKKGDVDLIAFSTLNTVPNGKLVAILDQLPFYICTKADNQELLDEINISMSEMMVHTPEIASQFYQSVLTGKNPISYTKEEHDKIVNTDTIIFGVYGDRLPLSGVDSEGNCIGIYVDLLNEIAIESGLHIQIKPIEDSNKLYSYIDDGTVDFVIGIQELRFSQDNADQHLSSNHLTDCSTIAITKPEYILDDATAPLVALTKDRIYLESTILGWFPKASIVYYDTRRECLDAINNDKMNVTFLDTWEYNYESKNARYENLVEWESYHFLSGPTLGGSRQSDLEILSILEKTIGKISPTRITDIITSNLNKPYETYTVSDRIYEAKNIILVCSIILFIVFIFLSVYLDAKRQYIDKLKMANKAKSDFLSRMSHELRTPLNAISGYTTVIEENLDEHDMNQKSTKSSLASIHRAVKYQLSIIDDLLDIQQLESGKLQLHEMEVEICKVMDNIVSMMKTEADEKNIEFIYDQKVRDHHCYLMDGVRFQQVLLNLLHNAVKFTPSGGTVKLITDIVEQGDKCNTLKFTIEDTGIGMSQEFQNNYLFTRFAQEYAGNTSPYEGCGTGLDISREIIHRMGGEITCTSKKGKGSTFSVILKTKYLDRKKKHEKKTYPIQDLSGIRILLCEDNKMNQDMESRLLQKMHCNVDLADDGLIGFDKFIQSSQGYYSIILMDIRMPNMDGWECTRQIRALDRSDAKNIPIIAISANAFEDDIKNSLDSGMNEHLSKPINVNILTEKIIQYCSKNQ